MTSVDVKQIWTTAIETMQAFGPFYRDEMLKAIEDSGLENRWFPLHLARGIEPEPLSVKRYYALGPYPNIETRVAILEELAETAYMDKVGEDAYRVTEPGKALVEGIFEAAHISLGKVSFLADEEMAEIAALLKKLVKAVEAGAEPPAKWPLEHSRATDPGEGSSYASQIDQYLTDLYFFREGAHIAAWEPYGVAGYVWETLTFLWNEEEEANTGAALAERLQGRGYTEEDYAQALEKLVEMGWAEAVKDGYQITEQGRRIRDEGEAETDRICFSSWDGLSEAEQAKLYTLLTRLKAKLGELTEEKEAQAV
ncbi:MAG: hypothetical protein JXB38_07925 [Anaerolineales bacterium]|nr:hypothetical protein [Anaerolineales bacterium]